MQRHRARENENGTALVLVLVIMFFLVSLVLAQSTVVQTNLRAAKSYALLTDLHAYAESGVSLAIHDFDNYITGDSGNIGTAGWTVETDDLGVDGLLGTLDEGEGDGIPTPGEPNLDPQPIGPAALQARLLVIVYPTPYTGVFRIVSTCYNQERSASVERVYKNQRTLTSLPSPLYVSPDTQLAFGDAPAPAGDDVFLTKGDDDALLAGSTDALAPSDSISAGVLDILISGLDHDRKGVLVPDGTALHGLVTNVGESPADNAFDLTAQLPEDGVVIEGEGGTPSVGESEGFDFGPVFDMARGKSTLHLLPGSYKDLDLKNYDTLDAANYKVIETDLMGTRDAVDLETVESGKAKVYVDGNLELTGNGGVGLLTVNGDLVIKGPFTFKGVLIVHGNVTLAGGDSADQGIHIVGGLVTDATRAQLSGSVEILYSTLIADRFDGMVRTYSPLFYREL